MYIWLGDDYVRSLGRRGKGRWSVHYGFISMGEEMGEYKKDIRERGCGGEWRGKIRRRIERGWSGMRG
jgi:hypothetical protein